MSYLSSIYGYKLEKVYPDATYILIAGWYPKDKPADDHSYCIGVHKNGYEAIGHAYLHLGFLADDRGQTENLTTLFEMDDEAGWMITLEYEGTVDYVLIYLLSGEEKDANS